MHPLAYWHRNSSRRRRWERGRFQWPATTVMVSRRQLQWLLDGRSLEQQQAHLAVAERTVI